MKCAYEECKNEFEPKTHNQKYCSDECCRIATNIKIKNKYREKKERLSGKVRICKTPGCNTVMSRYFEDAVCELCRSKAIAEERKQILKELGL